MPAIPRHPAPCPRAAQHHANQPHANPHTPDGLPATPDWVCAMLEDAGATLLALPHTGYTTRLRTGGLDWVRDAGAVLAAGSGPAPLRPAAPSPAAIDRMDRALAWLALIPDGMFVLRKVAGARAMVHPVTGRHLFHWRRLGAALGADHKAVQRWHGQAMARISAALNAPAPGPSRPASRSPGPDQPGASPAAHAPARTPPVR